MGGGRILGDLLSTSVSNADGQLSDHSSGYSGSRRILGASDSGYTAARALIFGAARTGGGSGVASEASGSDRDLLDLQSEDMRDVESVSGTSSLVGVDHQRILAASDAASDAASSDSASSAGFNSFGITRSSMWSGMSGASSASSVTDNMLTHRRPLLEGYASALRPLFMTRGDLTHLLSKFPTQVLLGGAAAGARSFAAHRELLEELAGSVIIAVKSSERRGKIKLAFGESFTYTRDSYSLGPLQTSLKLIAHGVRRTGNEAFPVVYEDEHEDDEKSEAAVSAARGDAVLGTQGVLEFEEVCVPLTDVSSRELFLAELMQSDQCQLLASLSQGSHSKYGHRNLRRRRRTLRHVREATQLLASVPEDRG